LHYAVCLEKGKGISLDLSKAAHYYKLSTDHGNSHVQNRYTLFILSGKYTSKDLSRAVHYFKLSADQENSDGRLN